MDKDLVRVHEAICADMWSKTYALSEDDRIAAAEAERMATLSSEPGGSARGNALFAMSLLFTTKWIHCGRTKLVVGQKYASALMSSAVTENMADDLIFPWKAFSVDLPPGLLEAGDLKFERINVGVYEGLPFGCCLSLLGSRHRKSIQFDRVASDPASMFFASEVEVFGSKEEIRDLDVKERAMRLAIRLVTGLLYTMQHTNNFRERTYRVRTHNDNGRAGPPPHRVYFVGRPMTIDCRPAVAQYMGGGRSSPPTVQSLVRGHYKRQVVGVGRGGRKVIWVEPYWRGPEAAPILARPYKVGPSERYGSEDP